MAGTGQPGYANGSAALAKFYRPTSIVYNPADGYYYIADSFNNCVRRMDASGNVTTYAGSSTAGYQDGSTTSALFNKPADLGIYNGYLYVSDTHNNCIRQIDMTHLTVTTFIN
jgi:DNA-binding beta-propeller fold protein YncE